MVFNALTGYDSSSSKTELDEPNNLSFSLLGAIIFVHICKREKGEVMKVIAKSN